MKKNQFCSIMNIVLVSACVLMFLSTTSSAYAQDKPKYTATYTTQQPISLGDTVMIHRDSLRYLTGERMAKWVYDKPHYVTQIGTRRFPTGILVNDIYSWIPSAALIPVGLVKPIVIEEQCSDTIVEQVVDTIILVEPETTIESPIDTMPVVKEDTLLSAPIDSLSAVKEDTLIHSTLDTLQVAGEKMDSVEQLSDTMAEANKIAMDKDKHMNRLSIGVRGGFATTMTKGFPLGYDAFLDVQYAHYWRNNDQAIHLGILTGLSAGYMSTHQTIAWDDKFTTEGIDYHITATKIDENLQQVILELPLMFSMITPEGLFLNVGPKLMLPVYNPFKQTITNGNITAYIPELNGEPITNEVVMGKLTDEQINLKGRAENELKLALSLGFEVGYEFALKNKNSIALGLHASCAAYSMYQNSATGKIISLIAPNENSAAIVSVQSMTKALSDHIGHFDMGIKLSYNFNSK